MKILKNDIRIVEIGQAVLKIFEFKVKVPRKILKIRNFANVSIKRVLNNRTDEVINALS